jgi:predicted choloylglycine hydrolase
MSSRWGWFALFSFVCVTFFGCDDDEQKPESSVEDRGHIKIVRLKGTPYQMGVQHGTLLYEELEEGAQFIQQGQLWLVMEWAADYGFVEDAWQNSFPSVIDECRGIEDGTGGVFSADECLVLAYGEVVIEFLEGGHPLGCSQFVATGSATTGGQTIHGRNLDWDAMSFIENNPVVFLREPKGAIPYLSLGFPGNVAPFSGISSAGMAVASNEASAIDDVDRQGRGHVQMVRWILENAHSLEEAEEFIRAQDHTTAELLVVSDGVAREGAVFEMTANHLAVRNLSSDDVVYAANHFVAPGMADKCRPTEPGDSSWNRMERLGQLLEPGGPDSLHGSLDTSSAIAILRDTVNVHTGETHPPELVDGGGSIANNGSLQSVVFLPESGVMYVGVGPVPAVTNEFVGFGIDEVMEDPGAALPDPQSYP